MKALLPLLFCIPIFVNAQINFSEPPDLPSSPFGAPTFTLEAGNNMFAGSNFQTDNIDFFRYTLPTNFEITSITITATPTGSNTIRGRFLLFSTVQYAAINFPYTATFNSHPNYTIPGTYVVRHQTITPALNTNWTVAISVIDRCATPAAPTVTAVSSAVCVNDPSILTLSGNLISGSAWHIYDDVCGGNLIATTTSNMVVVTPSSLPTTYYIRSEGVACAPLGACGEITLIDDPDTTIPEISCPAAISFPTDAGLCSATITLADATVANCANATITSDAPTEFPMGDTTVRWTATNLNGDSVSCTQVVTIIDNDFPVLNLPADIIVNTDLGVCGAMVSFIPPSATDNCGIMPNPNDVNLVAGPGNGAMYSIGTTTNTYQTTDLSGNTSTASFTVTVVDVEAPALTCLSDIIVPNNPGICGASVTFDAPTINNPCSGDMVTQTEGLASGSIFPVGSTQISYEVTDASGNVGSCSFEVVVTDQEIPFVNCPSDTILNSAAGLCGAVVNYTVTGTDNCSTTTTQMAGLSSGSVFPVGTTVNSFETSDNAGNIVMCSFQVTVLDVEAPTTICSDFTVFLDANGMATIDAMTIDGGSTDNCEINSLSVDTTTFNCTSVGANTVTLTATDASGNSSSCTAVVTVVDAVPPIIACPADQVVETTLGSCSAIVNFPNPPTSDNCDVASVMQISGLPSGSEFPIGVSIVSFEAEDIHGNTSACSYSITVEDTEAPTILCSAITISLDATGVAAITVNDVDAGSTDNCGLDSLSLDITNFDCSNIGENTVILTGTDTFGNSNSCSAIITVVDDELPTVSCQDITVVLDENGMASIDVSQVLVSASDNCGIASSSVDIDTFTCDDFGAPVTVEIMVVDVNGNIGLCEATVTVIDEIAPVLTCPTELTAATDVNTGFYELPDYIAAGIVTVTDQCTGPITNTSQQPAPGTALTPGLYTVLLFASDDAGNLTSCSFLVMVDETLGTTNNEDTLNMVIYPNPASDRLIVSNPNGSLLQSIVLYDLQGRVVLKKIIHNNNATNELSISHLSSANYVLQIEGENSITTKMVVKE